MSTDSLAPKPVEPGYGGLGIWEGGLRQTRIFRFAVGVTISVAIAYGFDWPLAFLMPILTAVILAMPLPRPDMSSVVRNMAHTLIAFVVGSVFTMLLLPYPLVYVPMLGLVLFHIYYLSNRGGSFWLVLMLIVAVLILPLLGNTHEGLALGFSAGFVITGWLTAGMVLLSHIIVPDPPDSPGLPEKPPLQLSYSPVAAKLALKSTIVVLPIATLFVVFDLGSYLLVMVFAAIFSLQPDIAAGKSQGMQSLISTLIGAAGALVFYLLIVAVPEFYFFIILMFPTAMYYGARAFSDAPSAKYYGSAFVALLLLVNGSLGADTDIVFNILTRAGFIALSVVYIVLALRLVERFHPD